MHWKKTVLIGTKGILNECSCKYMYNAMNNLFSMYLCSNISSCYSMFLCGLTFEISSAKGPRFFVVASRNNEQKRLCSIEYVD